MAETESDSRPEDDESRVLTSTDVGLALSRAGFGDVHVLSHEAADRALTENRRELLEVLARKEFRSISQLARRIGRDKGNVKRDLDVLAEENLVTFEERGRSKRPRVKPDTIVREPIVVDEPERR